MKHAVPLNQSVTRAIAVLEYLANAEAPRDLGLISTDLGMNKSTTFRFLSTLVAQGYVRQDAETGRYYLGSKVTWLATKFLEKHEVRQVARSVLERLARETGETVHLGILEQDSVIYIDKMDGRQAVQMTSRVGYRMPLHSTSLGKVLLSDQSEEEWHRYVTRAGLKPCTANTIVDPAVFFRELRQVRQKQYAIDDMENEQGIRCIAAPVRDHLGHFIAAVSVSGWTLSMTPERVQSLVPVLEMAVLEISARLGFQAQSPVESPKNGRRIP